MAVRRPLVSVNGIRQELPSGDILADALMSATHLLAMDGLVGWFTTRGTAGAASARKADGSACAVGDSVATWQNQVSGGFSLTSYATAPIFQSGYLQFSGGALYHSTLPSFSAQNCTAFIRYEQPSWLDFSTVFVIGVSTGGSGDWASGSSIQLGAGNSTYGYWHLAVGGAGATWQASPNFPKVATDAVTMIRLRDGWPSMRRDDIQQSNANVSSIGTVSGMIVGGPVYNRLPSSSPAPYWNGRVKEVVVFNRALTTAEVAAVMAYLRS